MTWQNAMVWQFLAFAMHLTGAAAAFVAAGWIAQRGDRARTERNTLIVALVLTALWALCHAAYGPLVVGTVLVEVARNGAWIAVLYRLFANDGRHESLPQIRPMIWALVFVEALQIVLAVIGTRILDAPVLSAAIFQVNAMFRVLVAVGALVLLHNLYVGAAQSMRDVLRWTAAAFGTLWAFDLNYYLVSYLGGAVPVELAATRGIVIAIVSVPLAIGAVKGVAHLRLRPSRSVAFQTLSLLVISTYILLMAAIAQSLSLVGGDFGRLIQVGFVFAATVVALLWLPSQRLRAWVRVTAVKHMFKHRYDYRAEWLRFTQTIGRDDGNADRTGQSLQERAIKAMADITDSPGGLLFLRDDTAQMQIAARWNWAEIDVPAASIPEDLATIFNGQTFIADIDELRSADGSEEAGAIIPEWLLAERKAWAIVPLLHFDRLTGFIVLARPAEARRLDWEDFDLLRVVGQQLASYLAEQSGQVALMEAARFDEFNRRIAFVMHDIKNLASQLALLSRNAERHADKPEFRADMLVTLRNSADKLNALLARLNRYGANPTAARAPVDLTALAQRVVAQFTGAHPVTLLDAAPVTVCADAETLEQALVHLVQNAVDASTADMPVLLDLSENGEKARIELIDSGCGMTAEFVRNGLFKPFVSSKQGGFGIGALEARELIAAMGGRLDVESREGLGTRFTLTLPVANAGADAALERAA